MNYWFDHYHDKDNVDRGHPQKNVGRTINGVPPDKEHWQKTIEYIVDLLGINKSLDVLEVCCGNGQVIGEISKYCRIATGLDYSRPLLEQLSSSYPNVNIFRGDILDKNVLRQCQKQDVVIMYFALQHFNEAQCISLIELLMEDVINEGGVLFLGDIPNGHKLWKYVSEDKYKRDYIQRIKDETPLIGNWFYPEFFEALNVYFDNYDVHVHEQPQYQINSHFRFDVVIKK